MEREAAVQRGYQDAANVPLKTAEDCLAIFPLAEKAVEIGNPASVTDAGVSALMAHAGMLGAIMNVRINLGSITDHDYRKMMEDKLDDLEHRGTEMLEKVMKMTDEVIKKA